MYRQSFCQFCDRGNETIAEVHALRATQNIFFLLASPNCYKKCVTIEVDLARLAIVAIQALRSEAKAISYRSTKHQRSNCSKLAS